VTTSSVPSAGFDSNDSPLAEEVFALSQAVWFDQGPMKMWKLHLVAETVIGVFCW